jgi:hypothetical protein
MSDLEKLGSLSQHPRPVKLANPGTLYVSSRRVVSTPLSLTYYSRFFSGLFSFASTTFMLSMFNVSVRNIHTPNLVVGMALFCGGFAQLLAGMWEFPNGNTLGAAGTRLSLLRNFVRV